MNLTKETSLACIWHVQGIWDVPEWDAKLTVFYYWSDPEQWLSTAGEGKAVPVTAQLEGMATVGSNTGVLKITLDYMDFFEVIKELLGCPGVPA